MSEIPVCEINSRDFLASLNRMVGMNNEYFISQFEGEEKEMVPQFREIRVLENFNY